MIDIPVELAFPEWSDGFRRGFCVELEESAFLTAGPGIQDEYFHAGEGAKLAFLSLSRGSWLVACSHHLGRGLGSFAVSLLFL